LTCFITKFTDSQTLLLAVSLPTQVTSVRRAGRSGTPVRTWALRIRYRFR